MQEQHKIITDRAYAWTELSCTEMRPHRADSAVVSHHVQQRQPLAERARVVVCVMRRRHLLVIAGSRDRV